MKNQTHPNIPEVRKVSGMRLLAMGEMAFLNIHSRNDPHMYSRWRSYAHMVDYLHLWHYTPAFSYISVCDTSRYPRPR